MFWEDTGLYRIFKMKRGGKDYASFHFPRCSKSALQKCLCSFSSDTLVVIRHFHQERSWTKWKPVTLPDLWENRGCQTNGHAAVWRDRRVWAVQRGTATREHVCWSCKLSKILQWPFCWVAGGGVWTSMKDRNCWGATRSWVPLWQPSKSSQNNTHKKIPCCLWQRKRKSNHCKTSPEDSL